MNNPLKYTGQQQDPGGLYNLRARHYNPTLGSFTQTDPMPLGAGTAFESAYVYGASNPLVYVDPSGLQVVTTGGLDPARLVGNEGRNIVSRQREMILSTASKYGLMAELPAAILLGENDFRPIVADGVDFSKNSSRRFTMLTGE